MKTPKKWLNDQGYHRKDDIIRLTGLTIAILAILLLTVGIGRNFEQEFEANGSDYIGYSGTSFMVHEIGNNTYALPNHFQFEFTDQGVVADSEYARYYVMSTIDDKCVVVHVGGDHPSIMGEYNSDAEFYIEEKNLYVNYTSKVPTDEFGQTRYEMPYGAALMSIMAVCGGFALGGYIMAEFIEKTYIIIRRKRDAIAITDSSELYMFNANILSLELHNKSHRPVYIFKDQQTLIEYIDWKAIEKAQDPRVIQSDALTFKQVKSIPHGIRHMFRDRWIEGHTWGKQRR